MFTFTAFPKRTKHTNAFRTAPCLAPLFLAVLLVPAVAWAQVLYGSLVGNVADPNGAAVSGARVEITNVATGDVSTIMTDDRGAYSTPRHPRAGRHKHS